MTPEAILKQYFGYDTFREGQKQLIDRILTGGDVLGIMPTGAGKSVCYQVPAMLLSGVTVVVSPLISLMQDQVAALMDVGIPAACLHSNLSDTQRLETWRAIRAGKIRLLYVAPERLNYEGFLGLMEQVHVSLVAVDEAHCLSQWGQDFRPGYLAIIDFLQALPQRPVVAAFTATATEDVRADIKRLLSLNDPLELVTGFDRPNLCWRVEHPSDKYTALLKILKRNEGKSGIVYCLSRKLTDEICEKLKADGFRAGHYHAGLSAEEREQNQNAFLRDELQIITATNAFGMGIDKSNVSFVVHYNMPRSMEAYYQEGGRAGRDGSPAECTILFSPADIRLNQFLLDSDTQNERLTQEQRAHVKQKDHQRLQAMIRYCHLTDCLRRYILGYFGENAPQHCGNCSSCLADTEVIDANIPAQKILSCVFRIRKMHSGCGVRMLCDVLQGKQTKQITERNYTSLSTYGLMADTPRQQLEQMVNVLISRGYLLVETGQYATIQLTAKANPVLRGMERIEMAMPKKPKAQRSADSKTTLPVFGADEDLFQRLRKVREKLAAKECMPAYIIFSDATLRAMCASLPQDGEALLEIPGVGAKKLEKYGAAFLNAIAEYVAAHPQ